MIQYQTWKSGLHILITVEHGSVQIAFPTNQKDIEDICNADCTLYAFWVDKDYRNKGIGNSLLRLVEKISKQQGGSTIAITYNKYETPNWVLNWYKANKYSVKYENNEYIILIKQL